MGRDVDRRKLEGGRMRTGTFFQMARGRAIVRKNAIRKARTAKNLLARR
jgi:hypothetical protein